MGNKLEKNNKLLSVVFGATISKTKMVPKPLDKNLKSLASKSFITNEFQAFRTMGSAVRKRTMILFKIGDKWMESISCLFLFLSGTSCNLTRVVIRVNVSLIFYWYLNLPTIPSAIAL